MQRARYRPLYAENSLGLSSEVMNIGNSALIACMQDLSEETTDHLIHCQSSSSQISQLLSQQSHDRRLCKSAITSPSSPDSGIESDISFARTRYSLPQCASSLRSDILSSNTAALMMKPRPLLRQRETYIPTYFEQPTTSNPGFFSTVSNGQTIPLKPMQVHKRQVPRRQDAIYNARYKTQPCLHYQKHKRCPLGDNCHFAHGPEELLHPQSHPKYRTRLCMNFVYTGTCPFGKNCYFLHSVPVVPSTVTPVYNEFRPNTRHVIFGT